MELIPFSSWPEVLAYAQTGEPLYYQAPLDRYPARLITSDPNSRAPFTYQAQARTIKIWPAGSVGRGRNRTADPFTADAGHLERFSRPSEGATVGEQRQLVGPGTDGVYHYRGASIELSGPAGGKWWATVRFRSQEKDFEGRSSDEALEMAKDWVDTAPELAREVAAHREPADEHAATELVMYIENTSDLSPDGPSGQGRSVLLNALRKWRKGTYDSEKAVRLFEYLTEAGAKRYAIEMGSSPKEWSTMFTPATRHEAAKQLEASFRSSVENGEYDNVDTRIGVRENEEARRRPGRSERSMTYPSSPSGQYVLRHDGQEVMRGTEQQIWQWMHRNHSYSVDHALRYEGYSIAPVENVGMREVRENGEEQEMWIDAEYNEAPFLAQHWYSGQGDPLYALASAGFPQPESTVEWALTNAKKSETEHAKHMLEKYGKRKWGRLAQIDPESSAAKKLSQEEREDIEASDEISRLVMLLGEALSDGERISSDEGWRKQGR